MVVTKYRNCLKCSVLFLVYVSKGSWYTCDVCRKKNREFSHRYTSVSKTIRTSKIEKGEV